MSHAKHVETRPRALASARHPTSIGPFALRVVEGPDVGRVWDRPVATCGLGSDPANDLVLTDRAVCRRHCELAWSERGARVRDLGSHRGTYLDGVRIQEAVPRDGSLLRLGESVVRFESGQAGQVLPRPEGSSADRFGHLIGRSAAMRTVFGTLARAAASNATVLIEGETGTGKEGAARALHDGGGRRNGPYVVVDCGALPSHLLESELFGHERGAFTGATERRGGAFEAADGGTIFLDEIGELPLDCQPKLLRALEARQVRRIGSSHHRVVDIRVVAATNRDLQAEVAAGRFRADLFYRLGVVRVRIPPLRERPEDIALLAEDIIARFDAPAERTAPYLTPAFLAQLERAAWPGNVRELRNYLEQCVVMQSEPSVAEATGAVEPPVEVMAPVLSASSGACAGASPLELERPYAEARRRALDVFERGYVEGVLRAQHNNVSRAARAAGLGRVYFYELLNKHKLR